MYWDEQPVQRHLDRQWFAGEVASTVVGLTTVLVLFALARHLPHRGLSRWLNRQLNVAIGTERVR